MSDDRYEIRSKIGQGGVGAVYRAFDRHLNREVAIKRVLPEGGYENQEEATKAMLNEAASLCSVQHPNIVTVFDAGVDNDGPYVVMELLSGRTIDEMIERGTLTLQDFREVAVQSQEALIAAQDLDLVHRDIKPTNVMVTWLPSGRFQVKIVDFGLAKFSPKPFLQTIDHGDSVFGSIHFMAPEQFERTPLDKRTDMYSMGCVYYYCLAGQYPFDGETAPSVMNAHLQHTVTPIEQLRPDLPEWLCKWVMWHLARDMDARPRDARESLKLFLMSEHAPVEGAAAIASGSGPQIVTPGAPGLRAQMPTGPVGTLTAPQPILPPEGQAPSIHTAAQAVKSTGSVTLNTGTGTGPVAETPAPVQPAGPKLLVGAAAAAPQQAAPEDPATSQTLSGPAVPAAQFSPAPPVATPLPVSSASPAAGKPLLVTGAAGVNIATPAATPVAQLAAPAGAPGTPPAPTPGSSPQPNSGFPSVAFPKQQKGISNAAKGVIAAVLAVAIIIAAVVLMGKRSQSARNAKINEITAYFKDLENPPKEIPLDGNQVDLVLEELTTLGATKEGDRETLLQALNISTSTDGSDIDAKIVAAATADAIDSGLRLKLFQLLGYRGAEASLGKLIEYASKTDDPEAGKGALRATRKMVTSENFESLLSIITLSPDSSVKNAAVDTLGSVIRESTFPDKFSNAILINYKNSTDEDSKLALLRLIGSAGGDGAADLVDAALKGDNDKMKVAAINSLRSWPDGSQFVVLLEYTGKEVNNSLRRAGFSALISFLKDGPKITEEDRAQFWIDIASIATGTSEQMQVIQSVVKETEPWAAEILDTFIANGDTEHVKAGAENAKEVFAENVKRAERGKNIEDGGSSEEETE